MNKQDCSISEVLKEQIPDQEVTSSKDSIYINVQSLKEYSRHIIAMANEFDRQKAVITKTELQMTSLLRTCHNIFKSILS